MRAAESFPINDSVHRVVLSTIGEARLVDAGIIPSANHFRVRILNANIAALLGSAFTARGGTEEVELTSVIGKKLFRILNGPVPQ